MKFSEMPYTRPDIEALKAVAAEVVAKLDNAKTAREQIDAYYAFETASKTAETQGTIAYIRHTINTKDEFYAAEQDWMDEVMPQMEELTQQVNLALLRSPFRNSGWGSSATTRMFPSVSSGSALPPARNPSSTTMNTAWSSAPCGR